MPAPKAVENPAPEATEEPAPKATEKSAPEAAEKAAPKAAAKPARRARGRKAAVEAEAVVEQLGDAFRSVRSGRGGSGKARAAQKDRRAQGRGREGRGAEGCPRGDFRARRGCSRRGRGRGGGGSGSARRACGESAFRAGNARAQRCRCPSRPARQGGSSGAFSVRGRRRRAVAAPTAKPPAPRRRRACGGSGKEPRGRGRGKRLRLPAACRGRERRAREPRGLPRRAPSPERGRRAPRLSTALSGPLQPAIRWPDAHTARIQPQHRSPPAGYAHGRPAGPARGLPAPL